MNRYYFLIFCIVAFLRVSNLNVSVFAELINISDNEEKIEKEFPEDEDDEDEEEDEKEEE